MEQTNRTILFEELNPQKNNIISFIMDDRTESLSDDELLQINQNLEVSSFADVLDKFKPCVYLALHTERFQVVCANTHQECQVQGMNEFYTIKFDDSYQMLNLFKNMLSFSKKNKGMKCTPANLLSGLFPLPDETAFETKKNKVIRAFCGENQDEAGNGLTQMLSEFDNSIFLIRRFLTQVQEKYCRGQETKDLAIVLEEKEETQVTVRNCSEKFYLTTPEMNPEEQEAFHQFVCQTLQQHSVKAPKLWELVLCMPYTDLLGDREGIIEAYQKYTEFYAEIVSEYWDRCNRLLQILLGIYVFFEQYQTSNPMMPPKMIIANMTPEQFIDVRYKEKLEIYLKSTNQKTYYNDTIWYAIVPGMEWKDMGNGNGYRERFRGNSNRRDTVSNSLESIQNLAQMLAKVRIQIFLSPELTDKTTNRYFISHGIDEWVDHVRQMVDSSFASYLYPCIPNFTLIPGEHAAFEIARVITCDDWGEISAEPGRFKKVWLRTIGVEASYAAAGIYAACQCPGFLKERFPKSVDIEFPGVAFPMTQGDYNQKASVFLRMDVLRYPKEIMDELQQKGIGIVFLPYKNHTVVAVDRAASYLYGKKDTLPEIQTLTYIERRVRYETQDYKSTLISSFFQMRPGSLREKWSQSSDMVNSILKRGENISYHFDTAKERCTLELHFNNDKKEWIVELNK